MPTPTNAPYKIAQRIAKGASAARMVFVSTFGIGTPADTAMAIRDGKLNKKSGRRLATGCSAA